MPWGEGEVRIRNWRFVILTIYMTIVALGCAYGIKKASDATDELHTQALTFAQKQCESSNKARRAVYDLLTFAEQRVKNINNPQQSQQQKMAAIKFYEDAKAQIVFSKCPPPLP